MTYDEFKKNFLPEFLKIKSINGRIAYAKQHLQRIGAGSGRIVYDIDGEKVLKLAKNSRGVAQNDAEAGAGYYEQNHNILAKIYDSPEDESWLISEKAKPVDEARIIQLTGIPSLNELFTFLRNYEEISKGKKKIIPQDPKVEEAMWENQFAFAVGDFVASYAQSAGDMGRPSSYGEVIRNGEPTIVLTDYGLSDEVFDTHYSGKKSVRMYEMYGFADGNDDMLSDMPPQDAIDTRQSMWALMPYSVGDGPGVINEKFISFVENRDKYPNKTLKSTPYILDEFHDVVNNLQEVLNHVKDKKKFYGNLLELQDYLIRGKFYNREPLQKEIHNIDESTVKGLSDISREYADSIAVEVADKLNLGIPHHLGEGGNGHAYLVNDNKVLKLTHDSCEVDAGGKINATHPKALAFVFKIYKAIDDRINKSLFVLIQEYIADKPHQEFKRYTEIINSLGEDLYGRLLGVLVKGRARKDDQEFAGKTLQDFPELAKIILSANPTANINQSDREKAHQFMMGLYEIKIELQQLQIKSNDYMTLSNLGYKNGVLMYYDIGGCVVPEPNIPDDSVIRLPEGKEVMNEDVYGLSREFADRIANNVAQKYGYGQPKFMEEGSNGSAYDIGNNLVMKITKDLSEANENLELIGKPLKYIAQPYKVFSVKSPSAQREIFVIILEKLKTDEKFAAIAERLNFAFDKILGVNLGNVLDYYSRGKASNSDVAKVQKYLARNPQDAEYFNGLLKIVEECRKYGIESKDYLNPDNLGYKPDGSMGFFDVGFGNWFFKSENKPEEVQVDEDGSALYSTPNAIGQDDFPAHNNIDTSDSIENDLHANSSLYEDLEYNHVVGDATSDVFEISERVMSSMKGSTGVEVKDKCRLGGGTTCNQGDISNLEIKPLNEVNGNDKRDFWAWVSPENNIIKVPILNHKDLIMRVYKDREFGWDYDRVFQQAIKDGWVRVTYEYNQSNYSGSLALNGYDKNRVKDVFKAKFYSLVQYGNNSVFIDYENPEGSEVFSTRNSDSKAKLVDYISEEIDAKTVHGDDTKALQYLIDGKRDTCFIEITPEQFKLIEKNSLKVFPVRMKSQNSMMGIVYRDQIKALKLYNFAKSRGGYLQDKTPDEAREVGELLGYMDISIEEYIRRKYGKPVPPAPTEDDYKDLDEGMDMTRLDRGVDKDEMVEVQDFPLKDLTVSKRGIAGAIQDIRNNEPSRTNEPVLVFYNISNKTFLVEDGYHRVAQAYLNKQTTIPVQIYSNTWSDYVANIAPENRFNVGEGVADRYAEKEFNIADPNLKMDVQARGEMERGMGEVVGKIKGIAIYKNPKSLMNFGTNVRAIADSEGNLFVAQEDAQFYHGGMGDVLNFADNGRIYSIQNKYQLLNRVGGTHAFGLGDTGTNYITYDENSYKNAVNILRAAKRRNPQFEFYKEKFDNIKGEPISLDNLEKNNIFVENKIMNEAQIMSIQDLPFKGEVESLGGEIYAVGGAVRDSFLGKDSKDLDIIIRNIPEEQLMVILRKYGTVNPVGKSFAVVKFKPNGSTEDIDVALPRTEVSTGEGHKDFVITADPYLPIEKDLERRDFTINAIAKDMQGNVIDPFNGQEDLKSGVIRITHPKSFSDDPLRMLRAVQFASRFNFTIDPETYQMIRDNAEKIRTVAKDRTQEEFLKIIEKGDPAKGAFLLKDTGLLRQMGVDAPMLVGDEWNNVKTLAEFVYLLTSGSQVSPAVFYKRNLRGDVEIINEINGLIAGLTTQSDNPIANRAFANAMVLNSKGTNVLQSKILPQPLQVACQELLSGKYPKTTNDLAATGDDMKAIGYVEGKELGSVRKDMLLKVYADKLRNDKQDLLAYAKQNNAGMIKEEKKPEDRIEFGCLAIFLDVPVWNKITSIIRPEDIYEEPGYGIETDAHTTILYGFHDEVTSEDCFALFKKNMPLEPIKIGVKGISIFNNLKFDVVKFDVNSEELTKLNGIMKQLPHDDKFPDYHPHITIAYVKRGEGSKYIKQFEKERKLVGKELVYTWKGHRGNDGDSLMLDGSIDEGVADKYAEKAFNIPDSTADQNLRASAEVQKAEEKPVAMLKKGNVPVFENPRSLTNFGPNTRAIVDKEGNIFVAQKNGQFNHGNLAMALGIVDFEDSIYTSEFMEDYQLLLRVGGSNQFGLSDASEDFARNSDDYESIDVVKYILGQAKSRNPQYDFIPRYYQDVNKPEEINEPEAVYELAYPEMNKMKDSSWDINGVQVGIKYFVNKYYEWNQDGYKDPTERSVLEFIQNNYEDFVNDENLRKELLRALTDNDVLDEEEMNRKVLYTAVVLDDKSRAALLSRLGNMIPETWETIAHHMTMNLGPIAPEYVKFLGMTVVLNATEFAMDDKVMAVGVEMDSYLTKNAKPHVTLAVNRANGGKPMMSNKLTEWQKLSEPLILTGKVTEVE